MFIESFYFAWYDMNELYDKKILRNAIIIWIVISLLLLLEWPYGIYGLGKLLIVSIDIYIVSYIYNHVFEKMKILFFVLLLMILVFNPIFPIYFHKTTWQIFDVLSWFILIITYFMLNKDQIMSSKFYDSVKRYIKKK